MRIAALDCLLRTDATSAVKLQVENSTDNTSSRLESIDERFVDGTDLEIDIDRQRARFAEPQRCRLLVLRMRTLASVATHTTRTDQELFELVDLVHVEREASRHRVPATRLQQTTMHSFLHVRAHINSRHRATRACATNHTTLKLGSNLCQCCPLRP